MLNDTSLPNHLFRIEHLFDAQAVSSSTSDSVLSGLDLVDELDQYLTNNDHISDSSHTSSPLTTQLNPNSHVSTQFEFILNAVTASSARINEETTTYLNQGQPYEIKFQSTKNSTPKTYRSVLHLCFWDKTLQNQEHDLMDKWTHEYQSNSLFDIDMNLTYGILSITRSKQISNAVEIVWDTMTTTSLFVRFKCTSTDFALKRHGGEKGIPLRIQIDTYENDVDNIKYLHSCCCKIQLFRLKGAQRKIKADQIRIERLTSDHTVLQTCPASSLYTRNLLSLSCSPDDLSHLSTDNQIIQKKPNHSLGFLSTSLPDVRYTSTTEQNNAKNTKIQITIRSTNDDVLNWLKQNNFTSVLNRFEYYTGTDLLRLTSDDLRRICNNDDSISIRLYNQLNEIIIPPLKTLYIKTSDNDHFSAIYLHALTRRELIEKICQFIRQPEQHQCNLVLEFNKLKIKIDHDNVVKYSIPNEGQFLLKISPHELVLYLISLSV